MSSYHKFSFLTHPGNGPEYDLKNIKMDPDSPLRGKTIIFLGSSVTDGFGACGISFADYLAAKDGIFAIKKAINGTTLVTQDKASYIPRMEKINHDLQPDAFICQLSTNDARLELPLGRITDGPAEEGSSPKEDHARFDCSTIAGAMEYIISYARATWNCPVYFYTNEKYDSEHYGKMVELLLQLQQKWQIGVIDLWNDEEINAISEEERKLYLLDPVHPTKAGYLKWWLPAFEAEIRHWGQVQSSGHLSLLSRKDAAGKMQ